MRDNGRQAEEKEAFARRVLAGLLDVFKDSGVNFTQHFMTPETIEVWHRASLDIPDDQLNDYILHACVLLKLDPKDAKPLSLALRMRRRNELTKTNALRILKVLNNHETAERNALKRTREAVRRLRGLYGDEGAEAKEVFQLQAALAVGEQIAGILDIRPALERVVREELKGGDPSLADLKAMTVRLRADVSKMPPATYNQIRRETVAAAERFRKWTLSNHPEREMWRARAVERFREYYAWMHEIGLEAEVDAWLREALPDYPGPAYRTLIPDGSG